MDENVPIHSGYSFLYCNCLHGSCEADNIRQDIVLLASPCPQQSGRMQDHGFETQTTIAAMANRLQLETTKKRTRATTSTRFNKHNNSHNPDHESIESFFRPPTKNITFLRSKLRNRNTLIGRDVSLNKDDPDYIHL